MADIKLVFDESRVTIGDLMDLEEAQEENSVRQMANIFARFVQNGSGEPMPEDEALAELRKFTLVDLNEAVEQFREAAQGADSPK